jgi:LysR family transcriptional regulator, low CO2-responsive transcriptional regulator
MYEKWLKAFHAVASKGGFTAAAKVLKVGQPTISSHVKTLEDYFGVELFHRRGRNVEITPLGRSLLTITQGLYGHEDEAVSLLRAAKELDAGQLKVSAIGPYDVMELLEAFQTTYPKIQCEVTLGSSAEVLQSLLTYQSDIAVIGHEEHDPRIFYTFYNRHRVLVIVNTDHPWAHRQHIKIEELDGQKMVLRDIGSTTRQAFERARDAHGVKTIMVMEINNREAVREAVIRGLGIGVVSASEFAPHERLRALTVTNAEMYTYAYVSCLAVRRKRPLLRAFFETAEALIATREAQARAPR